ncbi:MAG: hypothetical protein C4523_00645 [Myxococcales bacterium]|nr:MAG: hypothetical protein C4523_00645 [Myxococcales bacterium]
MTVLFSRTFGHIRRFLNDFRVGALLFGAAAAASCMPAQEFNVESAQRTLAKAQASIDAIRESGRADYAKEFEAANERLAEARRKQPQTDAEKLSRQSDIRVRVIAANQLRYRLDEQLLNEGDRWASEARLALRVLRQAQKPRPDNLSAYLTQAELDSFGADTRQMRERNAERLRFWAAELKKWQDSWDSGRLDYEPPPAFNDRFRFYYDNKDPFKDLTLSIPGVAPPPAPKP